MIWLLLLTVMFSIYVEENLRFYIDAGAKPLVGQMEDAGGRKGKRQIL